MDLVKWFRAGSGYASQRARVLAFLLDFVLLSAVCLGVGFAAYEAMAALGRWGPVVGFVLGGLYFLLDSALGSGQTLGKRVMGVRILRRDGQYLAWWAALLRYAVLVGPIMLVGPVVIGGFSPAVDALAGGAAVAVMGVQAWLLLLNRPALQGVHDLVVAAVAVSLPTVADRARVSWPGWPHWAGCSIVVLLVAAFVSGGLISGDSPSRRWSASEVAKALEQMDGVAYADIRAPYDLAGQSTGELEAVVYTQAPPEVYDDQARQWLSMVVREHPAGSSFDEVRLVVRYGWHLGYASNYQSKGYVYQP